MPPRLPMIILFLACYLAVIAGGGVEALSRTVSTPLPGLIASQAGVAEMRLTVYELIAALAALFAAPDAALRPARTIWDRGASLLVAAFAVGLAIADPSIATVGYGALTALAVGDALAALFRRTRRYG